MKKLVNLRCYVAIGDEEFRDTSIWTHLEYIDENLTETIELNYNNFADAYTAVQDGKILNAETDFTFWRSKPVIKIPNIETIVADHITEKTFTSLKVKWVWEEPTMNYTLKDLYTMLKSEQMVDWLKDRGITSVGSL